MDWENKVLQEVKWNGEISNREEKEKIALKLAEKVKNGDVIGFGSGSTSFLAVHAIAQKIKKENLNIVAIPTSKEIEMLCNSLDIKVESLNKKKPDWSFDGADEVSPENWLIKGRGGAMFREKIIMSCAKETYILVDDSKFVNKICEKFPIPVECLPDALFLVKEKLFELGADTIELRLAKGKDGPIITENGNYILDVIFTNVTEGLEKKLKSIVGVIETGLFMGYNITIMKS